MTLRRRIRSLLRRFGWDVVRYPPAPSHPTDAWASLRRLDIRTVIDVGAFDGDTARIFREMWPNAELHCFEPQAAPYAALRAWAAQQGPQVHTYDFALGDAPGTATMRSFVDALNETSFVRHFEDTSRHRPLFETTMRIERLDDVLNAEALTPGVFIKIDVEGFEDQVVAGLSRPVPALSMEFTPEYLTAALRCIDHLAGLGDVRFQYSLGESMAFALPEWVGADAIREALAAVPAEAVGDLYARFDG